MRNGDHMARLLVEDAARPPCRTNALRVGARRATQVAVSLLAATFILTCQLATNGQEPRRERVSARRRGVPVICHRGASEFAHENTLEAYRASLELGADGNEIDIRATRDGVLVCFHDDMLDQLLDAFGDVADYDWADLQTFAFRRPGRFGEFCRIPTLEEVIALHRQHAGLLHLDIKRPGLDVSIGALLDRFDLWDHVIAINEENAAALLKVGRYRPLRYKGSLYADRQEVDPAAIKVTLAKPGEMVIVDDPRGVLVELGRKLGRVSSEPVKKVQRPSSVSARQPVESESELVKILQDDADWSSIPENADDRAVKARAIRLRSNSAEEIRRRKIQSPEIEVALARRVQKRSLHPEWMHDGLDGASALRALADLHSSRFLRLARECVWRDDPAAAAVLDPRFKVARSWTDFRTKVIVFDLVEQFPGEDAEQLCRDYLHLSDDEARQIGPLQYEPAARCLLLLRRDQATAVELLKHRRSDVRGSAILTCLAHIDKPWARGALEKAAPHALDYIPMEK